jgi:hypothetical protein
MGFYCAPSPVPGLNAPRVVPRIGQRIAAGMTQHVGMNREGQTSAFTDSLDLSIDGVGSERATAFSGEHEWANPFPSPSATYEFQGAEGFRMRSLIT